MWSENEIILRQIYLLKDFRGKGNGKLMIKEWVNYFVKKSDKFGVQDPNSITYNILIKLKYYSYDNTVTNKCYLVS
jgi:GNAT superfamily N-acetyltransferase